MPPKVAHSAVCCFHLQGICRHGDKCNYAHTAPLHEGQVCSFGEQCKVHIRDAKPPVPGGAQKPADLEAGSDGALRWEVFDTNFGQWMRIPNAHAALLLTEAYNRKEQAFDMKMENSTIAVNLEAGTQDWKGGTRHVHIRGILAGDLVVVGGSTKCPKCRVDCMASTRENSGSVEWASFDPRKLCWVPYADGAARQLEAAYKAGLPEHSLMLGTMSFIVDFRKGVQINDANGHRHVRRVKNGRVSVGGDELCVSCGAAAGPPRPAVKAAPKAPGVVPAKDLLRVVAEVADTGAVLRSLGPSHPLFERPWIPLTPPTAAGVVNWGDFTLLQWNVLFSQFANASTWCCPAPYLTVEHRHRIAVAYLQRYHPTILTLQEVDSPASPEFKAFDTELVRLGYVGVAKGKVRPNGDAVAIYWDPAVFTKVDELVVAYNEADEAECMNDVQVGLAVLLRHVQRGAEIFVATTHLKAAKLEERGRLAQMRALLERIAPAISPTPRALIVAGDLNTSPRWELVPALQGGSLTPRCGRLRSLYQDHEHKAFRDRPITISMPHTQDVLDYILYDDRFLCPTALMQVPGEREIVQQSEADARKNVKFRQLPIPSFPSDHLPLAAAFTFVYPPIAPAV